ncbi:MAG: AAA family ATPase [Candidatus Epulonipiscioides saccharophilum]|nr:MAG: AAA family ATPase [Epulopiscium sp. AS2M-Bin001]
MIKTIEGVIEAILYQNKTNDYKVIIVNTSEKDLVCTGFFMDIALGQEIQMSGKYVQHIQYGEQFEVKSFFKLKIKTTIAIQKFLSSGLIKGIGARLAKRIVNHFGDNTIKIIEQDPLRLSEVVGISKEKAKNIYDQYQNETELRNVMLALGEYDLSPAIVMKIYQKYKSQTLFTITKNPYQLAIDIDGIGFVKADEIAAKIGIQFDDIERVKSGILFSISEFCLQGGHTYCPQTILCNNTSELLRVNLDQVRLALEELLFKQELFLQVYDETSVIFLKSYYYREQYIAQKLLLMANYSEKEDKDQEWNFEAEMAQTEKELEILLVTEQRDAIKNALTNGVTVITGGPGTGKTTIIKALIHMLNKKKEVVLLAAPTGRAAKRMSEATTFEAKTIHRLLEISFTQSLSTEKNSVKQFFNKNEDNLLETDVLIVDEVSMVDIFLMDAILKALAGDRRLVLIGDINQLPSVNAGNVLKDIIDSQKVKVIRLEQIFRQSQKSAIITNAHKINLGEYPIFNTKHTDCFFIQEHSQEAVKNTVVDLIQNRLPNKYQHLDKKKDIQILAPIRNGMLGVHELNIALQDALNQSNDNTFEHKKIIYKVGDKVMQTKNNYNLSWHIKSKSGLLLEEGTGIYNGDIGIIKNIDKCEKCMNVVFDEKKNVVYSFKNLDELDLAYATTIHKAQGSEYPVVIIPLLNVPYMLLSRNLLYTAITRAKKMVIIVGIRDTINRMVDNNREIHRFTSLLYHLQASI